MKLLKLPLALLSAALLLTPACLLVDDDMPNERGYVRCGDDFDNVICQPGTYCSSPTFAICTEGCVSDANCMEHEQCLKDKDTDRVGDCIPTKTPPPCCR